MTNAELEQLTDEQLIELVATKVMGWIQTKNWQNAQGEEGWHDPANPRSVIHGWNPLTDGNAMLDVIERVHNRDIRLNVEWLPSGEAEVTAIALDPHDGYWEPVAELIDGVIHERAPRAVAIASLLAVEEVE